mgnify:CR=1 FL=1
MKIVPTNDIFDYELKGIGEEPLASGHFVFECIARKLQECEIWIENTTPKD